MNLFELFVKIDADTDGLAAAINKAESNVSGLSSKMSKLKGNTSGISSAAGEAGNSFTEFGDKVAAGVKNVAKVAAVATIIKGIASATKKAIQAVADLTRQSVEAYAEYEQLVGGVETLFKSAAQTVQDNAANAYKTAGMSANEYMDTVTSFSASLINSMTKTTESATINTYSQVSKTLDAQYDKAKESYDKQYNAAKSAMDKEIDDYQKATEKKIKLVNQEYEERLKLIDEEEYKRTKKLDKQIEAINKEEEEQQAARKKQQQEDKKAELQSKIDHAKTYSDKRQAEKDYNDYIAEIQADAQSEARKKRIEDLQSQKEEVKDAADKKREAIQSAQSAEIEQIKEAEQKKVAEMQSARDRDLEALKSSNNAKLKQLKSYYDQQKALAKQAAEETGNSMQATPKQLEEAAKLSDMALTDMSDNVNKLGTNMESVKYAYQGFSKQQFQMLDNLRLGYGGNQQEMERLLKDAEKLTGQKYDISSFSDIIKAIHAIQENLGITGTTAKEATTTIQGSLNMTKAAWQNVLIGMADDQQDFGALIDNLVESAGHALENILPRVQVALEGVGKLIEELAPVIAEKLPGLVTAVIPSLTNAIVGIVEALTTGIQEALPTLMPALAEAITTISTGLLEQLPTILQTGLDIIVALGMGIAQALPELVPTVVDVILKMCEILTDPENLMNLLDAALEIIAALAVGIINSIPKIMETAPTIIYNLVNAIVLLLPKLLDLGIKLIIRLVAGIIQALPKIAAAAPKLVSQLIDAIIEHFSELSQIGIDIINEVVDGISSAIDGAAEWGADLVDNFLDGVRGALSDVHDTFTKMGQDIRDLIGFSEPKKGPLSRFHTFAPDMMALFAKGIRENESLVTGQIKRSFDFGEQTIGAGYNVRGSGAGGAGGAGNVNVTLGVDPNASLNALARALLPVLKIVAKEVG